MSWIRVLSYTLTRASRRDLRVFSVVFLRFYPVLCCRVQSSDKFKELILRGPVFGDLLNVLNRADCYNEH